MALNNVHKWSMEGVRYTPSHHSRSQYGGSSWASREARPVDVFLALAVALVVIAVLCIAGLAIYLGAMRIDARSTDIVLDGRLQVSGGAPNAPQLQLALLNSSSTAFQQAARFYTNLLDRLYRRSELGPALRSASVRGFSLRSATLVIFFRLQLDRRRTTTIEVEELARSILVQEAGALKPVAFTDMQMDAEHIVIKRHEGHQDDDERKNATEATPHMPLHRPAPSSPSTSSSSSPGLSTGTLSTVTTRPLVLSTQNRSHPGGRRSTTTTTPTTSTATAPPTWEEATMTFTGTGAPVTDISSRNHVGSPIMALDTADDETTVPPPPTTEQTRATSTGPPFSMPPPRLTGVVEPIAKEDVIVDPWNAPYGDAATRRPPSLPPSEGDDDSSWRPVRPTHQQHQQHLTTGPAVPILLTTAGDDVNEDVAVGVAEVVAIPSSAIEGAVNASLAEGALVLADEPVPVPPVAAAPPPTASLLDRLSLSPSEAFRQDLLIESNGNQSWAPVDAYAGDVGMPVGASVPVGAGVPGVSARPGDTVSKISLIVSGEEGEVEPETSILQTGSGSIVIKDEHRAVPPTTTTALATTASSAAPSPLVSTSQLPPREEPFGENIAEVSVADERKVEVAKAEMRNSNIRMPGLFALPDFPLLQQFPNLLGVRKTVESEQRPEQQQASSTATTTTARPASSEESVTIVTLLPVRSNSGLRRPLRRKPILPTAQSVAAPELLPPTYATLPTQLPTSPPPQEAAVKQPTSLPKSTASTRKQDDNSAKILSSIKLVLESRQSHYTSTPATDANRSNSSNSSDSSDSSKVQAKNVSGHVDKITHFIIPPERDAQRVNLAHIERVTTEAPPNATTVKETALRKHGASQQASPHASPPSSQHAVSAVTGRTPHRGLPKGNKTSTQNKGQPGRPVGQVAVAGTKRPPQKSTAQRVPRPQQTSSRLKETVVRTNVHVGQAGPAGLKAGAVASTPRPTSKPVATTTASGGVQLVRVASTKPPHTANATSIPAGPAVPRQGKLYDVSVGASTPRAFEKVREGGANRRVQDRAWVERAANLTRYRRTIALDAQHAEPVAVPLLMTSAGSQFPGSLPGGVPRSVPGSGTGEALRARSEGPQRAGRGAVTLDKKVVTPTPTASPGRSPARSPTRPPTTTTTTTPTTKNSTKFTVTPSTKPVATTIKPTASVPTPITTNTNATAMTTPTKSKNTTDVSFPSTTPTSAYGLVKFAPSLPRPVVSKASARPSPSPPNVSTKPVTSPARISTNASQTSPATESTETSTSMKTTLTSTRSSPALGSAFLPTSTTKPLPTTTRRIGGVLSATPSPPPLQTTGVLEPSPLEKTEAQRNRTAQLVAAIRAAVGLPAKSVSSSSSKLVNGVGTALPHKVLHKAPASTPASTTGTASPAPVSAAATAPSDMPLLDEADEANITDCGVRCGDGSCVAAASRCNQLVDCQDGADERGCACADYLRAKFMQRKLCDGVVDCWDYSDESNCDWCEPGRYVCSSSRVCVEASRLCDGHRDCPYGDDERHCVSVAPDAQAAADFVYHSEGFVMVRRRGKWGKLCAKGIASQDVANETRSSSALLGPLQLGEVVCRALTFSGAKAAALTADAEQDQDAGPYFETGSNITDDSRQQLFIESECPERHVFRVSCKSLQCGERPQSTSNWARAFEDGPDRRRDAGRRARIVGGTNSGPGAWPWQAALYKEGEFQCGATLVSDRWLLSAGHCFYHALDNYWVARLGALRRGTDFASPYELLRPLDAIVLHPGYVDAGFINDISLLRMREPVSFSDYIRPICLPAQSAVLKDGTMCTVVGWGQLFEVGRVFPDTLQEVQLPTISTAECRRRTLFLPLYRVNDNMFCAGFDRGGRDACLGDSGGPLMCQDVDGRWTLHGITSNGYGCARADRPGVYTKVVNYMCWVQTVLEGQGVQNGAHHEPHHVGYQVAQALRDAKTACNGHRCPLGQCLPANRVCNGFIECGDASDEKGCLYS